MEQITRTLWRDDVTTKERVKRYPPLIYVAGAYTGDVAGNIGRAEAASIALIRNGWHVITPHKNTSGYEKYENGTTIIKSTWLEMDLNILARCDAMYVMNGWRTSQGTRGEIDFATENDIPTFYAEIYPVDGFSPDILRGDSK